jgi:hypothetical protein
MSCTVCNMSQIHIESTKINKKMSDIYFFQWKYLLSYKRFHSKNHFCEKVVLGEKKRCCK